MKKHLARFMATALSVAMVATTPLSVLAADDPVIEGATGNILAYNITKVMVPTDIEIALNPMGQRVLTNTFSHVENTGTPEDPVYVTVYDGRELSYDQIISLNYGIVNNSTSPKTFDLKIDVTSATENTTLSSIDFVNAEEFEADRLAGVVAPEMYLAIATEADLDRYVGPGEDNEPNTQDDVREDVADVWLHTGAVGWPAINGAYTDVNHEAYIEPDYANNTNVKPFQVVDIDETAAPEPNGLNFTTGDLADVYMEPGNETAFVKNGNTATATVSFEEMRQARYAITDGGWLTFDTTQADVNGGEDTEIIAVGEVRGFTITGAMNADFDWTKLDVKALEFTPTYTIRDVNEEQVVQRTELPVAIDDSGRYQITLPSAVSSVEDILEAEVNGEPCVIHLNASRTLLRFYSDDVIDALGARWNTTDRLVFTFRIGDVYYIAEIDKN